MNKEIEFLIMTIHKRQVACILNEVIKVILDVKGIDTYPDNKKDHEIKIYKLDELLGMQAKEISEKIKYTSLLFVKNISAIQVCVAIPGEIDIRKFKTSGIMLVPDYIRRKQTPFAVWGFIKEQESLYTLITFSHFDT